MPSPVLAAGHVTARVMPVSPPVMPVMPAPVRPVPMSPVPAMSAPVMVMSVAVVGPRVVSAPVMAVAMVLVPVVRGMDPRAGGPQRGHGDEQRRAGCEESEQLIP